MVSINNTVKYSWGKDCFGWHLLKTENLGVIQEIMPPGTEEQLHRHKNVQQFFYILKGEATFTIDGKKEIINQFEGLGIEPGVIHNIRNNSKNNLEFLVISQPHSHGDRENVI